MNAQRTCLNSRDALHFHFQTAHARLTSQMRPADLLDDLSNPTQSLAWPTGPDTQLQRLLRRFHQVSPLLVCFKQQECCRGIAMVSVGEKCQIDIDEIFWM